LKKSLPFVLLLVLIACVLLIEACGTSTSTASSPKQAVENLLSAVKKNDYNAIYDMLTAKDKKQVTRQEWVAANSSTPASVAEGNTKLTWSITGSKVTGNTASINVKLTQGAQSENVTFSLTKESGTWKVSLSTSGPPTQ
jgi:Domain of unknown function (DUF4878)